MSEEQQRQMVEIVGGYTRTCTKCKRTATGKATDFHWSEIDKCYTVSQWEMPKGWSEIFHHDYSNVVPGVMESPTTYFLPLCGDCSLTVLDFVGWKRP